MKKFLAQNYRIFLLTLAPLLMLGYVGYVSLLPLGGVKTYMLDFGGEDTSGSTRLIGPFNRISEKLEVEGVSYRNLEGWGVYFELEDPGLGGTDNIEVRIRFKDNFLNGERFILGARDLEEWSYNWKDIYIPFYSELKNLPSFEGENLEIYSSDAQNITALNGMSNFLESPPIYSVIATNNASLVNQVIESEAFGQFSGEFVGGSESEGVEIDAVLRGSHTCWTYVDDGLLNLYMIKRDLNWHEGKDELRLEVYSLDDELVWATVIRDDGDENTGGPIGPLQAKSISLAGLDEGSYRIELIGGDDQLITSIKVNQDKFVISDRLHWAGTNSAYLGQSPIQDRIYFRNTDDSAIAFSTSHTTGVQTLAISGNSGGSTVDLDEINTNIEITLQPGVYELISDVQDIIIDSNNYYAFTPDSFFIPKRCNVVALRHDLGWVEDDVDFVLLDSAHYIEPTIDGEWFIAHANWSIDEVFIKDSKFNFCLNVPHLGEELHLDRPVPVDWIEVQVIKSSIWGK